VTETLMLFHVKGLPDVGPFEIAGKLTDQDGKWQAENLDLHVETPNLGSANLTGKVRDLLALQGLDLTIRAKGKSVTEILGLFDVKGLPDVGPFEITGKLTDPGGKLKAENLDLHMGTQGLAKVELTGAVNDLLTPEGMECDFSIEGKDLARLEKIAGRPLPFGGPFRVSGHAAVPSLKTFKLSELQVVLQDTDIGGSAQILLTGNRPSITADLSSKKQNLRPQEGKEAISP